MRDSVADAIHTLDKAEFPDGEDAQLRSFMDIEASRSLREKTTDLHDRLASISADLEGILTSVRQTVAAGHEREGGLKDEITASLVAAGGSREDLIAFDRYQERAANYEILRTEDTRVRGELETRQASFIKKVSRRQQLAERHRALIGELSTTVDARFGGQIQVGLEVEAILDPLDSWIRNLRQKGVTRWWNGQVDSGTAPGATALYESLKDDTLDNIGMSGDVASTFREVMTADAQNELCAVRCPDKYVLEWRVSDDPVEFREMGELSGGQQVSLLLSLLLQAKDDRPIVIDQPEDELDSQYLFGTILPVLRELKGCRQIIFATHDANIVVNGDADQVICLDADHKSGWVRTAGAIEMEDVRTAIVDTVDGGAEAFQLRQRKYGY